MPIKVQRIRIVVEYEDGSKETMDVTSPVGEVIFSSEQNDPADEYTRHASVFPYRISSFLGVYKYKVEFRGNDATTIVVQQDNPKAEEPGNAD
jgi:hypothetical protein